jgi:hypothetical protein
MWFRRIRCLLQGFAGRLRMSAYGAKRAFRHGFAPAPVLSKRAETALGQYPGTGATRFPGDQLMHSAMRYHSVR